MRQRTSQSTVELFWTPPHGHEAHPWEWFVSLGRLLWRKVIFHLQVALVWRWILVRDVLLCTYLDISPFVWYLYDSKDLLALQCLSSVTYNRCYWPTCKLAWLVLKYWASSSILFSRMTPKICGQIFKGRYWRLARILLTVTLLRDRSDRQFSNMECPQPNAKASSHLLFPNFLFQISECFESWTRNPLYLLSGSFFYPKHFFLNIIFFLIFIDALKCLDLNTICLVFPPSPLSLPRSLYHIIQLPVLVLSDCQICKCVIKCNLYSKWFRHLGNEKKKTERF